MSSWGGHLLDLLWLIGLGWALWRGYRWGLLRVSFNIGGLVLATGGAILAYNKLGPTLVRHFHLPQVFAALAAFAIVWLLVEAIYLTLAYRYWRNRSRAVHSSPTRLLAAGLSAADYIVMLALGLMLVVGLPVPAAAKNLVNESVISRQLLASTNRFQAGLNQIIDHNIASTLNFFTIASPNEEEGTLELGFHVTNGKVNQPLEAQMLILVNKERTSRGLKALKLNVAARAVARAHSQDMFARGYFSHVTPEGLDPFQRMTAAGITYTAAGENLALAPTLQLAHNGLMNSPGHRANILSPNYTTVGIGIIDGGRYGLMITQDFTN